MTDEAVIPAAEPSFSDYMRAENAREQDDETSTPSEPTPVAKVGPVVPEAAVAVAGEPEPPAPVDPVAAEPDAERNADGTFKTKSEKVTQKGEWLRNQQLTAKLREAERERDAIKAAPDVAPIVPLRREDRPADPRDPEPTIDQFLEKADPYAALAVEAAKWAVRQDRYEQQARAAQSALQIRIDDFLVDHPDYHERVNAIEHIKFPPPVLDAITEDDLGPAVAYHLATHPDEARRIAALRPLEGVKAIGKLLTRFEAAPSGSAPQAAPVSQAKPLIKPVSAAPVAPESPPVSDLPFGLEYIRRNNAADRKRAEAMRGT